jgi:prepilin-type N-terminal cleavage/methylation domain-containing protein
MTVTSNTTCRSYEKGSPHGRRGFSLLELIVVISITTLLMGLLMPTLSSVRENARRVICGANQRQFGQALTMYSGDHRNRLPVASILDLPEPDPGQLSLVRSGSVSTGVLFVSGNLRTVPEPLKESDWDGLGRLFQWHYCAAPETFYCPSHEGDHCYEECKDKWESVANDENLYANYQYVGHKDWRTGKRRSLLEGNELVLLTDGMRTKSDYSHGVGYNELRGDGSVSWKDDVIIRTQLLNTPPVDFNGMRDLDDLIYKIFTK